MSSAALDMSDRSPCHHDYKVHHAKTHRYARKRDTTNTVPMVRVVSADDMDPIGLPNFDIILPNELDGRLVGFRSRRQEDRVRQSPRSMTDQYLA